MNVELKYFFMNSRFAFTIGDAIVFFEGEQSLFETEDDAIDAADRHGLAVDSDGKVIRANKVFIKGFNLPLRRRQLAAEAGGGARYTDYPARITGTLCACGDGQGEFELLPKKEGQKVYMKCRICGEYSHL
jgi:hypothetical protein